jgi:hypothetical protein
MTRIVVTEFVSLDGVMEEPRWTFDFDRGQEGDQFKYEELFDAESLLLGRVTYQGFAAAWPGSADVSAETLHAIAPDVSAETRARQPFDTPYGPAVVSHVNLNDGVVEGLRLLQRPVFSVQYHPEAAPGPHDAADHFDQFCALLDKARG